jgi:NAD(P)-dependent dehydrogenase (short-subunit alcohol dehydrogenase family)
LCAVPVVERLQRSLPREASVQRCAALFERINREHGKLDILVNSIAGEDPMMDGWVPAGSLVH